jgi:hypothetical protein
MPLTNLHGKLTERPIDRNLLPELHPLRYPQRQRLDQNSDHKLWGKQASAPRIYFEIRYLLRR